MLSFGGRFSTIFATMQVITVPGAQLAWRDWLFVFVIVHYMWWFLAAIILLAAIYTTQYGWAVMFLMVAVYAPSFMTPSERRGGRPWNELPRANSR